MIENETKSILTSTGKGIRCNGGTAMRYSKIAVLINVADSSDFLPNTEALAKMMGYQSTSTVYSAIKVLRVLGYGLDYLGRNQGVEVFKRPDSYPPEWAFLRTYYSNGTEKPKPKPTQAKPIQAKMEMPTSAAETKKKLATIEKVRIFGDNVVIPKKDYDKFIASAEMVYDDYSILIDLFNGN